VSGDAADDEPAIRIRQPVVDEARLLPELVSPPGWPRLPPPASGEKLAAYLERLRQDPFVQKVSRYFGEPRPRPFRPALMTLPKWRERYPDKPIRRGYSDRAASPNYYPDMVRDRLLVALCDQLLAGEVELRGVRLSSLAEERVPLALFRFEDMVLYPNTSDGGQLRPEGRLPEGLHEYRKLTLWPVSKAVPELTSEQAAQSLPYGAPAREEFLTNKGDQLPLVERWATARYGQGPLPSREQLLRDFRADYGTVSGVSDPTMRALRKALVPEQAKRGGRPPQP
jgi:hypothetical protein